MYKEKYFILAVVIFVLFFIAFNIYFMNRGYSSVDARGMFGYVIFIVGIVAYIIYTIIMKIKK